MKKKLKIYSTLLAVVLVVVIVHRFMPKYETTPYCEYDDEKLEFVTPPPEFETTEKLSDSSYTIHKTRTLSYTLPVKPKDLRVCDIPDRKMLLSTANGQRYRVTMKQVNVAFPTTETGLKAVWKNPFLKRALCIFVVYIIVILWIMYMAFRIIYNIRKGEVFVSRVAKSLEITGFLLSFLYLYQLCTGYIFTRWAINHIQLADYYIVYENTCNTLLIITGLALMGISQVILMGKDLKDDQELTI